MKKHWSSQTPRYDMKNTLTAKELLFRDSQHRDLKKRLQDIIKKTNPQTIIVNGDIKHEFGKISKTEWKNTLDLIDFLSEGRELILIKGNHDTILEPITDKKGIKIKDYHTINNIYLCHGREIHDNKNIERADIIIIGHEHPAISLRDKSRVEKYKCFLKGRYREKTLIVQPSFNLLTKGKDVLRERIMSPYIENIHDFEVYVVSDKILKFGKENKSICCI